MNSTSTTIMIIVVILVAAAVAALIWAVYRKRQSVRLKTRFGSEYIRTVRQLGGNESQAEAELRKREARVATFTIRPLTAEEAARFSREWSRLQGRFVDNPKGAVSEADRLVTELMTARGYPMSDFERRASDISVDHPAVVDAYRAAQVIAAKDARGDADTEELRKAIVHYRALFAELLETPAAPVAGRPRHDMAVQS